MKYCALCSAELAAHPAPALSSGDADASAGSSLPQREPALLFIGRRGRRYEICPACEEQMDRLLQPKAEADRRNALDYLYRRLFDPAFGQKSGEIVEYFRNLLSDEEAFQAAEEAVRQDGEEETGAEREDRKTSVAGAWGEAAGTADLSDTTGGILSSDGVDGRSRASDGVDGKGRASDGVDGKGCASDGVDDDFRISGNTDDEAPVSGNTDDESPVSGNADEGGDDLSDDLLSKEPKKTSLGIKLLFLFLFLLVGGGTLAYGILRSSVATIVVGAVVILLGIASVFAKD